MDAPLAGQRQGALRDDFGGAVLGRVVGQDDEPGGASRAPSAGRAEGAAEQVAKLVGAVEPGSRLGTKEELRSRCEVSVGTFNEALRLLQARGLVTVKPGPGGGLFSAEQSPMVRLGNSVLALDAQQSDVANAVRIRDALDPLLIEDALWHASPADISGLKEHIAAMERAAGAADPVAFVHANWRLHAAIAAISPNALLSSLYSQPAGPDRGPHADPAPGQRGTPGPLHRPPARTAQRPRRRPRTTRPGGGAPPDP
ncbi:FadR/GntR family transcriptional regulator [Streptomyces cyaneofuscatus]|uniref:FadR/GntR family transcriptional regulator n=1 Tax=Streptomyces cyaneofuscatus TaxID=66883 RepID=UPI003319B8FE